MAGDMATTFYKRYIPNCVENGVLLQYYMLNTVINFLFKNFIALCRHLAKAQLLLCDAQIYYIITYLQKNRGKINKNCDVIKADYNEQENVCNISTQFGHGVFRIFAMR